MAKQYPRSAARAKPSPSGSRPGATGVQAGATSGAPDGVGQALEALADAASDVRPRKGGAWPWEAPSAGGVARGIVRLPGWLAAASLWWDAYEWTRDHPLVLPAAQFRLPAIGGTGCDGEVNPCGVTQEVVGSYSTFCGSFLWTCLIPGHGTPPQQQLWQGPVVIGILERYQSIFFPGSYTWIDKRHIELTAGQSYVVRPTQGIMPFVIPRFGYPGHILGNPNAYPAVRAEPVPVPGGAEVSSPAPRPWERPRPRGRTITITAPGARPGPGGNPAVAPSPTVTPSAPPRETPPRGQKETKEQVSSMKIYQLVMKVADWITETGDFVDAFYEALPRELRCGPKAAARVRGPHNTVGKAAMVYKHFERVNWEQALLNLVANHFEDMIIGNASKGLQTQMAGTQSMSNYGRMKNTQQALKQSQKDLQQLQRLVGMQKGCS